MNAPLKSYKKRDFTPNLLYSARSKKDQAKPKPKQRHSVPDADQGNIDDGTGQKPATTETPLIQDAAEDSPNIHFGYIGPMGKHTDETPTTD